jgi:glycosyltransferase involved in cell wall biosynthesis
MRIAQVHPGCGIPVPPPDWGAIEKIVWEFHCNFINLGHESYIKFINEIHPGEYDIVHCHVANLALDLAQRGIPYIYQLHDHHVVHHGKESHTYKQNLEAIDKSVLSLVPARFLVDYFNHPKVEYFSHGVNTNDFYPIDKLPPTNPKLLMVAANGLGGDSGFDRKGFTFGLALAMKRNLEITIAGPSFNKIFFNQHLWMLNYSKLNLVFDTPNSKLLELYHNHDIFIHPTMLEAGHPNLTMVEAAAAGLPLIANWEYETVFHGAWRSPRDVFEMERGLDDILENFDFYRQRAINTGLELDWKNRTKELLTIYKKYAIQ